MKRAAKALSAMRELMTIDSFAKFRRAATVWLSGALLFAFVPLRFMIAAASTCACVYPAQSPLVLVSSRCLRQLR